MSKIGRYLNQHILGNVFDGAAITEHYSIDAGPLQMRPRLVTRPASVDDLRRIVRFAGQMTMRGMPLGITPRGCGSDKTGAAISDGGIILDMTGEMNRMLEIDNKQRLVRLQPGITLRDLNIALSMHGLSLPLNVGSGVHTIGGIVGNNLGGRSVLKYGGLQDYVHQAEVVLSNGDTVQTGRLSRRKLQKKQQQGDFEGEIYRKLDELIAENGDLIHDMIAENEQRGPNIADLAGYSGIINVKYPDGSMNLLPLLFGSQGTLAVLSELIIHTQFLEDWPEYMVAMFNDYDAAEDFIIKAQELKPVLLNLYDSELLLAASNAGKIFDLLRGELKDGVLVLVGFSDVRVSRSKNNIRKLVRHLTGGPIKFAVSDEDNYDTFLQLPEILTAFLNDVELGPRMPFADGAHIPVNMLGEYLKQLKKWRARLERPMPVFGSALSGIYNIRPALDLHTMQGRQLVFPAVARI